MLFGRISRIFVDIVGTFIVLLLLGVGLLSWRLSLGPLSLNFLTPVIERALIDESGSVTVKDTVLAWAGWRRNFELRVRGVQVLARDGRLMLEVPEMSVGLSARALLLHGLVAPTALDAIGVQLVLVRAADGTWRFRGPGTGARSPGAAPDGTAAGGGEEAPSALPLIFDELLSPPAPDSSLGYLVRASLLDSAIVVRDEGSGRTFVAHDVHATVRRGAGGLRAQLSAVLDIAGKSADLSADGQYDAAAGTLRLSANFSKLDPATVVAAAPELGALGGIELPLSGRIDLDFDPQFRLTEAAFDIAGENGRLSAAAYGLPTDAKVRRVRLRGRMPKGLAAIEIEDAEADFGGPTLSLRGRVTGLEASPHAAATVIARNVSADDMRRLWPLDAAPHAREWITENIVRATIGEAQLQISAGAAAANSRWQVEAANGTFNVANAEVNYLTPMPHIQGLDGTGKFTKSRVDITTSGGGVGDLHLGNASIALTALDTDNETAELDVPITGPLRDALDLVDGPPFGYLKKIGLSPAAFSGDAAIRLALKLPLKHDLKTEQIDVLATAQVQHMAQLHAALGQDVTDGDVQVRVDKEKLDLSGRVMFGPIPTDVEMRRNFSSRAPIVGRTRARARVANAAEFAALGFDISPYVSGPTRVAVEYVERPGGRSDVTVDASLDEATVSIAQLDWSKPAGKPAAIHEVVNLANGRATDVSNLSIAAGDPAAGGLVARGRASFAPDGKTFTGFELDTLKTGLTDVRAVMRRSDAGLQLDVDGVSFNAGPFLEHDTTPAGPERPPLSIDIKVDRLYFEPDRWLSEFHFRGQRGRDRWYTADLSAVTDDDPDARRHATLALQKFEGGRQTLDIVVEDAGAFLRDVGITPNVIGGRLEVHGATDEKRLDQPIAGHVHMSSYRVVRAPILARVLSVALLTGVVDSLTGRGIRFAQLDADFAYFGSRVELTQARSAGSAIGVTASGALDIDGDTIDLEGTIVPANALNSLPGKIPLIGNLLTGGGGGLFAVTYQLKGPMGDPKISVNPLSTLAPGFLRNLFGGLSGTSPTDATPESEKEIERQQPKVPEPPAAPAGAPPATGPKPP